MRRIAWILLGLVVLTGCRNGHGCNFTATLYEVDRAEFGAAWPFEADEAVIVCDFDGDIRLTVGDEDLRLRDLDGRMRSMVEHRCPPRD